MDIRLFPPVVSAAIQSKVPSVNNESKDMVLVSSTRPIANNASVSSIQLPGIDNPDVQLTRQAILSSAQVGTAQVVSSVKNHDLVKPSFKEGKIVIFDGFLGQSNFIDINSDGIGDISHGDVVYNAMLAQGVPADKIIKVDKGPNMSSDLGQRFLDFANIVAKNDGKYPETIMKDNKETKVLTPVSAVNFSQSSFTTISDVSSVLGLKDLTPENLLSRRDEIRKALEKYAKENPKSNYADYWKTIQAIDKLTAMGIPVYVAGGNLGSGDVNLFSLGNNAISVGATKPITPQQVAVGVGNLLQPSVIGGSISGSVALMPSIWSEEPTWGSASNSLISNYAQGYYPIKEVKDPKSGKVIGFDFTGDNLVDIPLSQVYDPELHPKLQKHFGDPIVYKPPVNRAFRGTSFAAPTQLGKDWITWFNKQLKK